MNDYITKNDFDELRKIMEDFFHQYNLDMRGDTNSDNGGRRGIVDNLREVRKYQKDYPSLKWLLFHKTSSTIAAIVLIHIFLTTLTTIGAMKIFGAMFGIKLP